MGLRLQVKRVNIVALFLVMTAIVFVAIAPVLTGIMRAPHAQAADAIWTEVQPKGDASTWWTATALSEAGQYALVTDGARLYASSTYGDSWGEIRPSGIDADYGWQVTSVSSTGQYMLAAIYGGRAYLSDDYGTSWNEVQPAGDTNYNWQAGNLGTDAHYIMLVGAGQRVWYSADWGESWSETQPIGDANGGWAAGSMSGDGSHLIVADGNGRVYVSDEYGNAGSWGEVQPRGNSSRYWRSTAISTTGQYMLAGEHNDYLHMSTDYGATWGDPNGATSQQNWYSAAMNYSGQYMLSGGYGTRLYFSNNNGANWIETQPKGDATGLWQTVAVSGDGTHGLAGENGRLYRYELAYDVNFDTQGGSAVSHLSDFAGESVTLPAAPTRAGYAFTSWNTASDGNGDDYSAGASYTVPTGDVTLYAQWVPLPSISSLSPSDNATNVSPTSNLQITFSTMVTLVSGNITIYNAADDSVFEAIPVNDARISNSLGVVTINPTGTLAYNASYYVKIDDTAVRDGAHADRYFPGIADTTTWNFSTPAAYTLSFDAQGGSSVSDITGAPAGSSQTLPAAPARDDYEFTGWNTNSDGSGTNYAAGASYTMPATDTTLYAIWEPVAPPTPDAELTTESATDITQTTVVLNGTAQLHNGNSITNVVLPGHAGIHLFFSWNTTASVPLGLESTQYTVDAGLPGEDNTNLTFKTTVGGLTCGTQYWYDSGYDSSADDATMTGDVHSFTTSACPSDTTALTLVNLSPTDNASTVSTGLSEISLTFNEPVTSGTGKIILKRASDNSTVQQLGAYETPVDISGSTATIPVFAPLDPETDYYVLIEPMAFKDLAGNFYTGIATSTGWNFSTEGDGIPSAVENAGPNGGDANNDGTPDSQQANVASFYDVMSSSYVAVATNDGCNLSGVGAVDAGTLVADNAYEYPFGLVNFTAACPSADVTLYFYNPPAGDFMLRKLIGSAYQTVAGATFARTTIGGQDVLSVSYTVTDGGVLDADGEVNGTIVDPAGPALPVTVSAPLAPSTGLLRHANPFWVIGTVLVGVGVVIGLVAAVRHRQHTTVL